MNLFIRKKSNIWINFIQNVDELRHFEEIYIPGRKVVLGDLSLFTKPMLYRLLKFVEDNPDVDCYSSIDIKDPILLSRFLFIYKEPLVLNRSYSLEDYEQSKKDYMSVETLLDSVSDNVKLRLPLSSQSTSKLLLSL